MRKAVIIFPLALGFIVIAATSFAHHGNASFEYTKKVRLSGTVTEWSWANPHSWLKLDSKDENGDVKHWIVEAGNPADMARQGWAHNSFKPGDELTITVICAKNGQPIARVNGRDPVVLNGKPFPPK
jgi:Family of unknown function (DUF6152)